MKKIFLITIFGSLSACSSINKQSTYNTQTTATIPQEINTFLDVCVSTAPTFLQATHTAREHGISDITDGGSVGKLGFNKDQSVGVQIKTNKECVITTESKADSTLTNKFIQALSQRGEIKNLPSVMSVNGQKFIFFHDREGGEAYVMLKAK